MFSKIKYVNKVKKVKLQYCESQTFGTTLKKYSNFQNIDWSKSKDKSGKIYITFSAEVTDVKGFFNSKNKNDAKNVINSILFKTIEDKRNKKLFNDSEKVLEYLRNNYALIDVPEFFQYDFPESSIRVYIHFLINSLNKVLIVSSGYMINLEIISPGLGTFSCLFKDVSNGAKCLTDICENKPLNIHTSF